MRHTKGPAFVPSCPGIVYSRIVPEITPIGDWFAGFVALFPALSGSAIWLHI